MTASLCFVCMCAHSCVNALIPVHCILHTHMLARSHSHTQIRRPPTLSLSLPILPAAPYPSPSVTLPTHPQGRCYGCASATSEHCITLLKALTIKPETRRLLVKQNLIGELVEVNLRTGSPHMQRDIRRLLCQLTRYVCRCECVLWAVVYSLMHQIKMVCEYHNISRNIGGH